MVKRISVYVCEECGTPYLRKIDAQHCETRDYLKREYEKGNVRMIKKGLKEYYRKKGQKNE